MKIEKILVYIAAISLIVFSIRIYFNPVFYSRKYVMTIDFTDYRLVMSGLLLFFGILIIYSSTKKGVKKK